MKKLLRALALTLVSVGLMGGVAAAQSSISNTGPGSINQINTTQTNAGTFNCNNTTTVINTNSQTAISGSSNVSGNTSGGSATSGGTSNSNVAASNINVGCGPVAQATSSTAPAGGQGGGSVISATTVATVSGVAALPDTGTSTILAPISIIASVMGSFAIALRSGVAIYKHRVLSTI